MFLKNCIYNLSIWGFVLGWGMLLVWVWLNRYIKFYNMYFFFYLEDVYIGFCVNWLGMGVISLFGFYVVKVLIGCNYKNGVVIILY